jgi:hypothetical protein
LLVDTDKKGPGRRRGKENVPVNEASRLAREEEAGAGDVVRLTDTAKRDVADDVIPSSGEGSGHHCKLARRGSAKSSVLARRIKEKKGERKRTLRLERSARKRVTSDPARTKLRSEDAGELMQGGFGGGVGVGLEGGDADTVD